MLNIKNLNIGYKSPLLDHEFSYSTSHPSLIALVGHNGSGKTTLIKTIAGLLRPITGQVILMGENIHAINEHKRAKIISIVLSELPHRLNLSVLELLRLTSKITHGFEKKHIIDKTINQLHIKTLVNKPFNTLSDGQKQKVMIARSLVQNTPILLMDEPFSHLDQHNTKLLSQLLLQLKKEKIILFATHDELTVLDTDMIWHFTSNKIKPVKTHFFLANSHQLNKIYNFYNNQLVKTGKPD